MVRNFRPGDKWVPGEVVKRLGPLTYRVKVKSGDVWKRHIDHVRDRGVGDIPRNKELTDDSAELESDVEAFTQVTPSDFARPEALPSAPTNSAEPRYPSRIRHLPVRYGQ